MTQKYDIVQFHDADRFGTVPKRFKEYIISDVYPMKDEQLEKFIKHEYSNKNIWRTKQQYMNRNRGISLVVTPSSILYQVAIECGREVIEREKYIQLRILEKEWREYFDLRS